MKNKLFLFIISSTLLFTACDDNNNNGPSNFSGEFVTATDIQAGENGFTFFNLRSGAVVADSNSTNWDLGFKDAGLEIFIITNSGSRGPGDGGGILLDVAFNDVSEVPADEDFVVETDSRFSIDPNPGGWWIYTATSQQPLHAVLPKTPHTILVRNADGNSYSKIEILSYYQGNPDTSTPDFANFQTRPISGYFSFNYEVIN